ncbi:hypothetical protein Chor_005815 [Crotalus horridus]
MVVVTLAPGGPSPASSRLHMDRKWRPVDFSAGQSQLDFLEPYTAAGTIQDYVVAMLCGREKPQMSVQNAAAWGYFILNIGTSAQLAVPLPPGFQPVEAPDPRSPVQYFPYFDNRYLAVAASLNGGNVMAAFVKMVAGWMAELGLEVSESDVYRPMIEAGLSQAESRLRVCPTLFGERHAPTILASVTDIAASDMSLGHVVRSLCRGVIQNLHSMLPSGNLKEAGAKRIVASGSGLCRNEVMKQEAEKTFALPMTPQLTNRAASGAKVGFCQLDIWGVSRLNLNWEEVKDISLDIRSPFPQHRPGLRFLPECAEEQEALCP